MDGWVFFLDIDKLCNDVKIQVLNADCGMLNAEVFFYKEVGMFFLYRG